MSYYYQLGKKKVLRFGYIFVLDSIAFSTNKEYMRKSYPLNYMNLHE